MDKMKRIIADIDNMVGRWANATKISAIERDIVLARIRQLYEEVQACEMAKVAVEYQPETAVAQPEICPGVSIDIEGMTKETDQATAIVSDDGMSQEEPLDGFSDSKPGAEYAPVKGDYEDHPKVKLDRDLIMSLYCEQSATDLQTGIHKESSVEITLTEEIVPEQANTEERSQSVEEQPEPVAAGSSSRILGEILGNGDKRLSDILSENGGTVTDVASKICAQQTTGLRKSIGVNDRFLLIRDLFDSDAVSYDSTINRLEEFEDLNEALLYIYENYSWDPNGDAVKLLISLLTRKLS